MAPKFLLGLSAVFASLAWAQEAAKPERPSPESIDPAVNTSAPQSAKPPADVSTSSQAAKPAAKDGKAVAKDRLQLDTTQITGNRELPKVLYIVPWKRSDLGDLPGRPVNSLLDEVLAPVDRDVFKRENRYYSALQSENAAPGASPPAQSAPASQTPDAGAR